MYKWDDIERRPFYQAPKWVRDGYRTHYSYIDEIRYNEKGATNMSKWLFNEVKKCMPKGFELNECSLSGDGRLSCWLTVALDQLGTVETFYADNKPYHHIRKNPGISRVIFNDPATIVFWDDGTKTTVKCQEGDAYSKETGLALCIAKKALGNKGNFNNLFKKWCEE